MISNFQTIYCVTIHKADLDYISILLTSFFKSLNGEIEIMLEIMVKMNFKFRYTS